MLTFLVYDWEKHFLVAKNILQLFLLFSTMFYSQNVVENVITKGGVSTSAITSTTIGMVFFISGSLSRCTNSLLMKMQMHQNKVTLQFSLSWTCCIWSWLKIINKMLGLNISWDHFNRMMHRSLISRSLLRLNILVSKIFKMKGVDKSGLGRVLHLLLWTIASNVTWFSTIQT